MRLIFWYFGVLVFLAVVKETLCRLELVGRLSWIIEQVRH